MEKGIDFYNATFISIKGLLHSQLCVVDNGAETTVMKCINLKNAVDALNKAIGAGGGHSIHPKIGRYWFFEYWPGIKLTLLKSVGENIISEKIERKLAIKIANECLFEFKNNCTQLKLF